MIGLLSAIIRSTLLILWGWEILSVDQDSIDGPFAGSLKKTDDQRRRFGEGGTIVNGAMTSRQVRRHCRLDEESDTILRAAFDRLSLSARAMTRVLKVSRTIADLAGRERIAAEDVAEAIQYRSLDRGLV